MSQRTADFGDCWRAEGFGGMSGGAWVNAGPILHEGLGSNENMFSGSFGWRYGYPPGRRSGDSVFPQEGWIPWNHSSHGQSAEGRDYDHECYAFLPILTSKGDGPIRWLHAFDLEVGGGLGIGVNFGFSPGEFLDFLLGWFGIDIAGDDAEDGRKRRDYYLDRSRRPEPQKNHD